MFKLFEEQFNEEFVNPYDIYGHCWHDEFRLNDNAEERGYKLGYTALDYTPWMFPEHERRGLKLESSLPCTYGSGVTAFMNEDIVKAKLHANENIPKWEFCTNGKRIKYTKGTGSIQLYQDLYDAGL